MNPTAVALVAFAIFLAIVVMLVGIAGICWGRLRCRVSRPAEKTATDVREKSRPVSMLSTKQVNVTLPRTQDAEAGLLRPDTSSPCSPRLLTPTFLPASRPRQASSTLSVPFTLDDPFRTYDDDELSVQRSPVSLRGENPFSDFDAQRSGPSTPAQRAAAEEAHGLEYPAPARMTPSPHPQDDLLTPSITRTAATQL